MGSGFMIRRFIFLILLTAGVQGMLSAQNKTSIHIKYFNDKNLKSSIEATASGLISLFNSAYNDTLFPTLPEGTVSDSAKKNLESIWRTRKFRCAQTHLYLPLIRRMDGMLELRGIPLDFQRLPEDSTDLFEEALLIFNNQGILDNFYLGLVNHQYMTLSRGADVKDSRRRQVILDFVENFRTSYNRKDLDFLNKVFSDNALIIVGKVVTETEENPEFMTQSLGKKKVELIRLNKQQYLDGLKKVFERNSFIKVDFENFDIIQHPTRPEFYGVNLVQKWTSSGYSDEGYLFLLIDFRIEEKPLVWVRAWQPMEDTEKTDVITLDQFILQ